MDRQAKIQKLMTSGADDERRLALDAIDDAARSSNSFGSTGHRKQRDDTERKHDQARRVFESLSDQELDRDLLAANDGALPGSPAAP
jgi:hypothetical protein